MNYKMPVSKASCLLLYILIVSAFNLRAEKSTVNLPSWFMKSQAQFSNGSRYCLKSAKSNTFFFDRYLVNQFISAQNEKDTINPYILNMRIDFENSNPHPVFEERDPLAAKSNFFIGDNASSWRTDVASFATLAYKNLYNKVDLVYYNSAIGIKSDFIVHAGGNISDISLKYSGIKDISINQQGALEIYTDAGLLTEHIPEAYQVVNGIKVMVNAGFRLKNRNTVNFEVADYNPDYDLVIDPQLTYSSYFGGDNDDKWSTEIVRDSQQNMYFGGRTLSSNFPVTAGVLQTNFSGDYDAFVVKLDPTGKKMLFSTFIGGPGYDITASLKLVGTSEDILVVGLAGEGGFPTTAGAYQTAYGGGFHDMYVLKLNNDGNNLIFSTLVGGLTDEQVSEFCLDKNGDIYVLGFAGYYFPVTADAYQQNLSGDYDLCVFKLSSDGKSLVHSTFIGGTDRDRSGGIVLDDLSNVYISGSTLRDFPTTAGAFGTSYNGSPSNIAVCKFDPTLSHLIFSTLIGGPGEDVTTSELVLDKDNNLILVGKAGSGFPVTGGAYDVSYNGGASDVIIIKLKNDGTSLLYSTYLGGPGNDFARDFAFDGSGNLIVTGSCGEGFPTTTCPYDNTFNGGATDCFISKFDMNTSSLIYSSYFGGSGNDEGFNIVASGDTIILIGTTNSQNLPATPGTYDPTYNGGENDIFLTKLLPGLGDNPVAKFTGPPVSCLNQSNSFINTSLNSISYYWDFGDGNNSVSENPTHSYPQAGNYLVSLIASNPCSHDTIEGSIRISGYLANKPGSICEGDSVLIGGLFRYGAGIYNETFLSSSGCDSIIATNLSVNPAYTTALTPSICEGTTFSVGTRIYTTTGIYTDLFKTVLGCDSIVSTNLTVNPLPSVSLGNDTIMCPGDLIVLSPGIGFGSYLWSDGTELALLQVNQPGTYSVFVSDGLCSESDTVLINDCGTELWFPNVFTPNNDGINENFKPVPQGIIHSYQITVFNRWGQQLYESTDAYTGWNGMYNGKQCPTGTYFFIAEFSIGADLYKQRIKRGSVTLLR